MLSSRQSYLNTALHQSLQDLLMDESFSNNNITWGVDPAIHFPSQSRMQKDNERSIKTAFLHLAGKGSVTPDLELRGANLSNHIKSHGSTFSAVNPTTAALSLRSNELLLVAAAEESRMLHRLRTAAVDRRRELVTGILQQSYCNREKPFDDLVHQAKNYKQLQLAQIEHESKTDCNATLKTLGSSLRKDSHYVDVSTVPDSNLVESFQRKTRGGVTEPFPEKLHRMIQEVEAAGNTDIISFFSHGRAFGVHDHDRFVDEVMCKYFKQSSYSSFRRQLNLYGFKRINTGPDAGGYYHELFLKGRANLVCYMRRVGVPANDKDQHKFRETSTVKDPDFYVMKSVAGPGNK